MLHRLCILALIAAAAMPLDAQQVPSVPAGARVRVQRAGERGTQDGTFVSLGGDTLIVRPGGGAIADTLPLADVRSIDVSRGVGPDGGRLVGATAFGLLVGAGAGWAAGSLMCRDSGNELCGLGVLTTMAIGGALGLVAGAVEGSRPVERWERVYPPQAALLVAPTRSGGMMVGLSLSMAGQR